jgi:N-formylglutamate amidohydrolase
MQDYLEFQKGTIPLIISVPHGGTLECENIPKRSHGILGIDGKTVEIAKKLMGLIRADFRQQNLKSKFPSYIISKVRRSKIDLNRIETEAFNPSSVIAREIYISYHSKLREFVIDNLKLHNRSLLLDIHGFEKDKRPQGFRDVDIILGTNNLESFFSEPIPRKDLGKNIRGEIIQNFTDLGIPIAPGHPKRKEYVLTGGYITKNYGASQIPKSQAMQIEFSDKVRIYDQKFQELVLISLARTLVKRLS